MSYEGYNTSFKVNPIYEPLENILNKLESLYHPVTPEKTISIFICSTQPAHMRKGVLNQIYNEFEKKVR